MYPVDMEEIKKNLKTQLSELETLQSMYNPTELRVEDLNVLAHVHAFVEGRTKDIPSYLDLTLNLLIDNQKFELCANLSQDYPDVEPDVYVRNHKLNKKEHAQINKDITEYIANLDRSEPCIFSAISWLQDNATNYIVPDEVEQNVCIEKNDTLVRFWIYSHHIYSKTKRREITDLASKLNITGFCMPGKPGVICVEGTSSDCNEWWQAIKSMNWKRIFCKIREECTDAGDTFLKFQTFEERVFQNNNIKNNHMDMGELLKYLEEHQCGYIFKDIFGVESKSNSS